MPIIFKHFDFFLILSFIEVKTRQKIIIFNGFKFFVTINNSKLNFLAESSIKSTCVFYLDSNTKSLIINLLVNELTLNTHDLESCIKLIVNNPNF